MLGLQGCSLKTLGSKKPRDTWPLSSGSCALRSRPHCKAALAPEPKQEALVWAADEYDAFDGDFLVP